MKVIGESCFAPENIRRYICVYAPLLNEIINTLLKLG